MFFNVFIDNYYNILLLVKHYFFNECYYIFYVLRIILSLHDSCECVNAPTELSFKCLFLSVGHSLIIDGAKLHFEPATDQVYPAA